MTKESNYLFKIAIGTIEQVWYLDFDNDDHGDINFPITDCFAPLGYVATNDDCDDSDLTKYPGAPGTNQGIDNNCNGSIDPGEVNSCDGDYNGDGFVDTADLLLFLSTFGCPSDCAYGDLSGDGAVDTQDLLLFLGIFGSPCDS